MRHYKHLANVWPTTRQMAQTEQPEHSTREGTFGCKHLESSSAYLM